MNKKLILNLITLVITTFLLIFVINAWYVSNEQASANGIFGKSSNDGFTLDLERGSYRKNGDIHWTWTSTKDLSINNMEPGDAFFFRFRVNSSSAGSYKLSLSDISSKIAKNQYGAEVLQRSELRYNGYYVLNYGNAAFNMDPVYKPTEDKDIITSKQYFTRSGTSPNFVYQRVTEPKKENLSSYYDFGKSTKTTIDSKEGNKNKSSVLYLYDETTSSFSLKDFLVQDAFRFYSYGIGNSLFMENKTNVINSSLTSYELEDVNKDLPAYVSSDSSEFYVYFALEFNEAASLVNYKHMDTTTYSSDSNLYQNQVLTIGHFGLEIK